MAAAVHGNSTDDETPIDEATSICHFSFDDIPVTGQGQESVAAALLRSGHLVLSRSLKYHRPRGAFCLEGSCNGCVVRIDGRPNERSCMTPCHEVTTATSQNAFPSAQFDVLGAVDNVYRTKLDHHGLLTGNALANLVANKVVRLLSGVGRLPQTPPQPTQFAELQCDVVVVGAGAAGLACATQLAAAGHQVVVLEQQAVAGGSMWTDPRIPRAAITTTIDELARCGGRLLLNAPAINYHRASARHAITAALPDGLLRVLANHVVWATGAYPRNLAVPNNDLPGVIAARGLMRLLRERSGAIGAGAPVALLVESGVAQTPELAAYADALALALAARGHTCTRVNHVDVLRLASKPSGGLTVERRNATALDVALVGVVAVPSPATEGPRLCGCTVTFDTSKGGFYTVPNASPTDIWVVGDVTGFTGPVLAQAAGRRLAATLNAALTPAATRPTLSQGTHHER